MSISGALSAATSGLSAAARSAELVSSNVANALAPGYGRREIILGSSVIGGVGTGVQVAGIERVTDTIAIGQRRFADAAFGEVQHYADFYRSLQTTLGTPDSPSSLTGRIAALEAALVSATGAPESEAQLGVAVNAAGDLVRLINSASASVQQARASADQQIASQVRTINTNLSGISDLNDQVKAAMISGSDPSSLMDQRQRLIDQISDLVPLQEIPRDDGRITLLTANGTMLVGQHAARFEFEPTGTIVPEMTVASGALSGLQIVNAESVAGTPLQAIEGGSLAANFEIRDVLAIDAQGQLDQLAQELIVRTGDPAVDPTLSGGPGLFTDAGNVFDAANKIGLASRLSLNSQVDPNQGGAVLRLRDGIGATSLGAVANTSILNALSGTLTGEVGPVRDGLAGIASSVVSSIGTSRNTFETREAFVGAQVTVFQDQEARGGVDTDQELQKLLVIEQSYAANAKMIEAIDQMMQSLLRI